MNFVPCFLALLALVSSPIASPFNGTWVIDVPSVVKDAEIEIFSIKRGVFSRGDVKSPLTVRADGRFHPMKSDGYVDAVAVTISGRSTVREYDRLNGKLVYSVTYVVAADRNTMTREVVDFGKPDGRPIRTTITHRRIGSPARAGSLVSGRWETSGIVTTQDHLTETLKLEGNRLSSMGPGGTGYDAEIGGPPVPMRGDTDDARVAVSMPSDRTIVLDMSDKDGPALALTMMMAPDNRTINATAIRHRDGRKTDWVMRKQ